MKRIFLALALCFLPSLALAQTSQTRASLYQNVTPSPTLMGNIIASMVTQSDPSTLTGSVIFAGGGTVFLEGSVNITSNPPTLSSCGTSPALTARSSNNAGEITLGTGSPTACTLTWNGNSLYVHDTWCTFTPGSSATAAISGGYYVSAHNNAAVTLTLGTGTSSAVFEYTCFGN